MSSHNFWNNEPTATGNKNKQIIKIIKNTKTTTLPNDYTFKDLDVSSLPELHTFLASNYVEDSNTNFKLIYSENFLKWQFFEFPTKSNFSICLIKNEKIVGFIHGKPTNLKINESYETFAAINFLCLDISLRNTKLAPLLIKEITRRFHNDGIASAIFTGSIDLPFKIADVRYYHYMLNTQKLYETGFLNFTVENDILKNKRKGFRMANEQDYNKIIELHNKNKKNYKLFEIIDEQNAKYTFKNIENVCYTFLYEENDTITEFGTFFIVDTLIKTKNEKIKTAYLHYYYSEDVCSLINDLLVMAKEMNVDVFNSLSLMNNDKFISSMNFYRGTGVLKYYFYNWDIKKMLNNEICFVLP